mgnify:CR=1 FL=1
MNATNPTGSGRRLPRSETTPDRPNVVLIVMDTARARDVLGRPDVTPNLHRIAENGEVVTNVFTTGPWTLPSHASMFTGQYTSDHGTHAGSKTFDPDVPPIAEVLADEGYQTAAFSNNSWVSSDVGFDRGFETFRSGWELFESDVDLIRVAKRRDGAIDKLRGLGAELSLRELPPTVANVLHAKLIRHRYDDGAWLTNRRIERWLDRTQDATRPFFAFVNYLEPHLEYRPPRGHRSRFLPEDADFDDASRVNQDAWAYIAGVESMSERDFALLHALYLGELHYLDRRIGALYDAFEKRALLDDTVVFVVGDHGENLGDHGLMDHQYSLHDTLTHVPLVCHTPEGIDVPPAGAGLRELRDLYPTILDLAGVDHPADPSITQQSLLDPRDRDYVIGEYVTPQPDVETLAERVDAVEVDLDQFDSGLRSIRIPGWKLVERTDGSEALYSVGRPAAVVDDSTTDAETAVGSYSNAKTAVDSRSEQAPAGLAARLRDRLHDEHGEMAGTGERSGEDTEEEADVGAATQQRLEDLGYI